MIWNQIGNIFYFKFDPLFTIAIAAIFFILGVHIKRRVPVLVRFCVPSGVVGGLCMGFLVFALHLYSQSIVEFDHTFQVPLIAIFFTRVGLTGSFRILWRGGKALGVYLAFCWGLCFFQNMLGIVMANLLSLHPILGVMAGSVSLMGGHNLAVIFGPIAESVGVPGAQAVAVSSATCGLIAGGLIGANTANLLIKGYNLKIAPTFDDLYKGYHDLEQSDREQIEINDFLHTLGLLLVLMATGCSLAEALQAYVSRIPGWKQVTIPSYVGALFLAMAFRNLNDCFKIVRMHPKSMDLISTAAVSLYLTTAMMSVRLWDIYGIAIPVVLILLLQSLMTFGISAVFVFNAMGRDYDAAIICSGFVGHGLGAPSSAVSVMRAACDYNNAVSYKALLIVPFCSAALIDIVALPSTIWFINYFMP